MRIINAFRNANNVAVSQYGICMTLYLATNLTAVENLDDYQTVADYVYQKSSVRAWVEFTPNMYRLRKLGFFNKEGDLPIVVHFQNFIDITRYSYVEIPISFLPDNVKDTQQWEIVDSRTNQLADIDVKRTYLFTPRRIQSDGQ